MRKQKVETNLFINYDYDYYVLNIVSTKVDTVKPNTNYNLTINY